MATPVQSTAPVETQCAEQVVGKDIKCKCLNDREQGHGGRGAEPSEEAGDAVAPEPVVMPFESFSADGSLPSRPLSFIQETYEMRYIADYPSPGDDMWVCHPDCKGTTCAQYYIVHFVAFEFAECVDIYFLLLAASA